MGLKLDNRIESEIARLTDLKWSIPELDKDGIFTPAWVDEELISFPSEDYSGEESNSEATGFWAEERADVICKMLSDRKIKLLWEIGAGNGNAAIPLRRNGIEVICVEPLRSGTLTLAKNGFLTFQSRLETLNLPDSSIEAIGAFDVLEHLEYPEILLREIFRILKPGGYFICSVPAYQWIFSNFHLSIGHYRRYSRKLLKIAVKSVDLEPQVTRSIFGYLVIPAFIIRRIPYLLGRKNEVKKNKTSLGGSFKIVEKLSGVLTVMGRLERICKLPIGLSIVSISKKPF